MEYEIGDDPQGLPDRSEAYRAGGLRNDGLFFGKDVSVKTSDRDDDAADEDSPMRQLGKPRRHVPTTAW